MGCNTGWGLLAWFPAQMRLQNGIYDAWVLWSGPGSIFCSRWDYELASLLWQGSRPGHRDCIAHCFLIQIQPECALNFLLRPPALLCSCGEPWAILWSSGTAFQLSWWTRPLVCSANYQLCLPFFQLKCYWTTQLQGVVANISGQIGPGYCFTVTKLCLTLCIPTDFRMPGFLVLHYLPEFVQIHVHWVGELGSIPGLGRSFGGGHGNPLQYSCLENPINREAWWATVPRVAKSQTRLTWLSMHKLVILSKHLILCCPLLLLPSIFLIIGVFSNELCVIFVYSSVNGQYICFLTLAIVNNAKINSKMQISLWIVFFLG